MFSFLSRVLNSLNYETPGGGSGGGSAQGGAPQGGAPSGGQSRGGAPAQGGTPGSGESAPIRFDPNATYDFGDGQPVRGSEYMSRYMPRDQYERGVEFLTNVAKTFEQQQQQQRQQQQRPRQPQQPRQDPFADIWSQPLVDGQTLKTLYQQGLGPIAQAIQSQQQIITQLQQQLQKVGGHVGSMAEQRSSEEYSGLLQKAVTGLGLPGFDPNHDEIKPLMPFLNEFARDVFDSHDSNDPNYAKEMPGIFRSRVENAIKFVRALDKVRVATQKSRPFKFVKPSAPITPGQQSQYKYESPAALARRLHGMAEAANQGT